MESFGVSWPKVTRTQKTDKIHSGKTGLVGPGNLGRRIGSMAGKTISSWSTALISREIWTCFEEELHTFLEGLTHRPKFREAVRLGFIGIPPIQSGLYEFVEDMGGRVVFNEIQRQFSMPHYQHNLLQQYLAYTYPYDIFGRIKDIQQAVGQRRLDGLIHYTQTFCFRQVQDLLIRKHLAVPILTLEGDKPRPIDNRTQFRIEAFIDVLRK